jgi:hypothetical protein
MYSVEKMTEGARASHGTLNGAPCGTMATAKRGSRSMPENDTAGMRAELLLSPSFRIVNNHLEEVSTNY